MSVGGFSSKRLTRVRDVLSRYLDAGYLPGAVAVVARRGEVHIEAMGNLAFEGEGSRVPMAADTIFRIASMSKPLVAACAMTLVEDCTLRLDDPVDEFLPELADMTVLADPNGPLDRTVPAQRAITLRDLLTFTLGTLAWSGSRRRERSRSPTRSTPRCLEERRLRVGARRVDHRVAGTAWTSPEQATGSRSLSTSRVNAPGSVPPQRSAVRSTDAPLDVTGLCSWAVKESSAPLGRAAWAAERSGQASGGFRPGRRPDACQRSASQVTVTNRRGGFGSSRTPGPRTCRSLRLH